MNNAFRQLGSGCTDLVSKLYSPGLVRPDVIGVSGSSQTIDFTLPSPFGVLFGSGLFATAHGNTAAQDTQSYSVNMASLFPSSGSVTGYVLASYNQVQQSPITITGPQIGHPAYDPAFSPYVGYTVNRDTLVLSGSTSAPDNQTTFEVCRCILKASSAAVSGITTAYQVLASPYAASVPAVYTTNTTLAISSAAAATVIAGASGIVLTLPAAADSVGYTLTIMGTFNSGYASIAAASSDLIYGVGDTTYSQVTLGAANSFTLWSTGSRWVIIRVNPDVIPLNWPASTSPPIPPLVMGSDGSVSGVAGFISTGFDDSSSGGGGQFRAIAGGYGVIFRNDGNNFYIMQTSSGNASGGFNSARPFIWNLTNGTVDIDGTGAGTTFGGNVFWGNNNQAYLGTDLDGAFGINFADNYYINANNGTLNFFGGSAPFTYGSSEELIVPQGVAFYTATYSSDETYIGLANFSEGGEGPAIQLYTYFGMAYNSNTVWFSSGESAGGVYFDTSGNVVSNIGQMYAKGFNNTSDRRLKTDLAEIAEEDALKFLSSIKAHTFKLKGESRAGFVAQDVRHAGFDFIVHELEDKNINGGLPELKEESIDEPTGITNPAKTILALSYSDIIAYHQTALQSVITKNKELEARIEKLEALIKTNNH